MKVLVFKSLFVWRICLQILVGKLLRQLGRDEDGVIWEDLGTGEQQVPGNQKTQKLGDFRSIPGKGTPQRWGSVSAPALTFH